MSRALLFLQHFPRRRCAWTGYWLVVRPVGFPAALRLDGLLVVVRPVGFPAALRLDGLLVVVRPVGFPAALRLAGLLAGGAACGMSSPGEAFMPTPGKFTGARCEKSPYFLTSSHLEYGGEGGIVSLRSPLRGSPLTAFAVCPTGCASCRTRSGVLIPPNGEYKRKKPVLSYELSSRIWR